jgi:hypothetical protein
VCNISFVCKDGICPSFDQFELDRLGLLDLDQLELLDQVRLDHLDQLLFEFDQLELV